MAGDEAFLRGTSSVLARVPGTLLLSGDGPDVRVEAGLIWRF